MEEESGEAVWVSRPKESGGPTRNVKSLKTSECGGPQVTPVLTPVPW